MTKTTPNTRMDAVVRIVEDVVLVAATGIGTWQASHSADDVLTAVVAAPIVRSGVASALSSGRVSGIVLALKLVRKALGYLDTASSGLSLGTVTITPVIAPAAPVTPTPEPATAGPAPAAPATS